MSQRRVAITGLGLVSPYGGDLTDFFTRLSAGESAVRYLLTDDLPRPLSIPFVSCPAFDPDATLGRPLASMMDRFAQLGMAAAFGAWDDAGLPRQAANESRDSWGVAWGTALGGTLAYDTRDNRLFPTSGLYVSASTEFADGLLGSEIEFAVESVGSRPAQKRSRRWFSPRLRTHSLKRRTFSDAAPLASNRHRM